MQTDLDPVYVSTEPTPTDGSGRAAKALAAILLDAFTLNSTGLDSGCWADIKRLKLPPYSSEEERGIEPQRTNRPAEGAA